MQELFFDTQEELRWAKTPAPMMLFHGDADRNVPYDAVLYDGNGFFGSKHIADMLTERRIPHWFYSVANTNHVMATRPMYDNRYEIDAFLEKLVLKREPLVIDTYVTPLEAPNCRRPLRSPIISTPITANSGCPFRFIRPSSTGGRFFYEKRAVFSVSNR